MIVLASRSKSRARLLRAAGIAFTQRVSGLDETALRADMAYMKPSDQAESLAQMKARSVSGDLVTGADQILEFNGEILHKPRTMREARQRLRSLCGNCHVLHTAVAICQPGVAVWSHVETAYLTMYDAPDSVLDKICAVEKDAMMSSPGAYRVEGPAVRLFSSLRGDYFSVLGLPLLPLLAELRRRGAIA